MEDFEKFCNTVRNDVLSMIFNHKSGHIGSAYSCVEIVVALYMFVLRVNPNNPNYQNRDRFILSKGHAAPTLYSVLSHRGFFSTDILQTFREYGSILQGHPDMNKTPGVDMTSGSLGNGLSIGVGMALGLNLNGSSSEVFVLLGDGELQEGMVWEAAMTANKYHLSNLTAIVDYNGLQINGPVEEVTSLGDVEAKWKAFGWNVIWIDGHNLASILNGINESKKIGTPTVLIAKTIKGKGVSFMEGQAEWHSKVPSKEEFVKALRELAI